MLVRLLRGLIIAAFYYFSARFSLWLTAVSDIHAVPVWIPSAVAFVTFLNSGSRYLAELWLAAFLVKFVDQSGFTPMNVFISSLLASSNLLGAWIGVTCLRSFRPKMRTLDAWFAAVSHIMRFILGAALLGPFVNAWLGFVALMIERSLSWRGDFPELVFGRWLGNSLGVLLYAPLIQLVIKREPVAADTGLPLVRPLRWDEWGCLLLAALVTFFCFGPIPLSHARHLPIAYLIFPVLTLAAFRLSSRGLVILMGAFALVTIYLTRLGFGPFALGSEQPFEQIKSLFLVQAFLGCVGGSMFVLKAALNERAQALRLLKERESVLVQSAKLTTLGQISSGIAHEINNPMGVIAGYAKILKKNYSTGKLTDADVAEITDRIDETVKRVVSIIKSLKGLSRSEERDPLVLISIRAMIQTALNLSRSKHQSTPINIIVEDFPDDLSIHGHPTEMEQVLVNLLDNARDAIGSGPGEILISVKEQKEMIQISVQDTGPGIPQNVRSRLFTPFYTTKEAGRGTGLGLSISQKIITSHGGRIWLEDSPMTTFVIELPRYFSKPVKPTSEDRRK